MGSQPDTITKIAVRGFKSIADEQQIELRPLTLLAGANSSGKSSIMQPILLLKQTLEAPSDPGALLLDGPNVHFTSADQLLSRLPRKKRTLNLRVKMGLSSGRQLEVVFKRAKDVGFEITAMESSYDVKTMRIVPDMSHDEILGVLIESDWRFSTEFLQGRRWSVHRDRCFLSLRAGEDRRFLGVSSISLAGELISCLQALIHLPGLRGNPQRTYPKRAVGPFFAGAFDDYVASIVAQWQSNDDLRLTLLGASLEDMGLTWKVEAQSVDDTQVELRVGRLPHGGQGEEHDLVNIADVGVGMSQSLPVVVALVAAEPGQVVYLEQPEIHLHPRAQRRLAHVLADAANRGVIVVAETHSSLLLREVQTLVATGKLATDKVKLHWFQRQADGHTVVTAADLDENGAFGDWPEDFDEVELNAERDYLDAVERKGAGE
jgi:predicted ATPase